MILDEIVEAKRVRLPEHKKRIDGITMRKQSAVIIQKRVMRGWIPMNI